MKILTIALLTVIVGSGVGLGAPYALADESQPSVKKGVEEVGTAVKDDTVKGYDKVKDATLDGTGTAVQKTGEAMNKAADALDRAAEKIKGKE